MTIPYTFEERVLLGPEDEKLIRVETSMVWNTSHLIHPFGKLQQALMDHKMNDQILQVTVSIASQSSQSFWSESLQSLPLWNTDQLPQFPSGFRLSITSHKHLSDTHLKSMTRHWMDQRVITTPLEGASWDVEHKNHYYHHQLYLPTNGAAWSADAWHQSMQALLPCTTFMGVSAMNWSKVLVDGKATRKQFWLQWSKGKATMGLQWKLLESSLLPTLLAEQPSCALATRSVERWPTPASPARNTPTATIEQVLRRPDSPNQGRLETWFTADQQQNCHFQLRQRLPYYLDPQWRSLQITTSTNYTASVDWNDDWSSVLHITSATTVPSFLILSLDYEPSFLSIDDFPGDPNRGRELPPAVVSITCNTITQQLYSNSVMILPPVPDMSMPFNVLSLSCSLYAYLIGTIFTLLVKRASEKIKYQLHPEQKPMSKLQRIMAKLRKRPSVNQSLQTNGGDSNQTLTPKESTGKEKER